MKNITKNRLYLAIAIWLVLWSAACNIVTYTPLAVSPEVESGGSSLVDRYQPPPAEAATPTALPVSATAAGTLPLPTPKANETGPGPDPLALAPTPVVDFETLAPYRQAMLPEFSHDVAVAAAAGASRYYLEVNLASPGLDGPNLRLSGLERVRYTNTEAVPLSDIYFHLYPNLPGYGGRMVVETVIVDDRVVQPELAAGQAVLRVPLAAPLAPEAVADISLFYTADIPGQAGPGYNIFSATDGTIALAGFYPVIAVYDDKGWAIETPPSYGDATYLDVSLYQVQLTVPQQMVVAASGSSLTSTTHANGTKTLTLASGPMRDFYLAMRADYQVASEVVEGTLVNSYYPPDLSEGGRQALRYAAAALRVYNHDFGLYPYAELDVVATPTNAGGVEYPGLVVISQGLYRQPEGFFEFATVHEVAHQWWYGLVGNDQVNDPWLDESLTNYSTVFYWEEVEGKQTAAKIIEQMFLEPYQRARQQGQDRAVIGPVSAFSEGEYVTFVYGKGPLFFDALRQEVGSETYLKIMQTYYSKYKYRLVEPSDLFKVIKQVSGQNVEPLVETWLENK
jgi:hypothetical protein